MPENVVTSYSRRSKWSYHHVLVFCLTFSGYALFHATRKTFSNVKTTIGEEWSPTNKTSDLYGYDTWNRHEFFETPGDAEFFLGALDTVFMGSYAVGLFIFGLVGDRFNMRVVLAIGMWLSAITVFMFGTVSEWLQVYNEVYYVAFWGLGGLFQASGWPITVAVMGNWFGKKNRGVVFGFWGACTSVGNISGTYLVAAVLIYGYQYAFMVPAALLFAGGVVILFSLIPSPRDVGLPMPDEPEVYPEDSREGGSVEESSLSGTINDKTLNIYQATCLPGVLAYSLAYACLKMVNYSFFFWLPFYLNKKFGWSQEESDRISTWYDVGGIVGAIVTGFISDHMERRSPTVMVLLIISPVTLLVYSASPADLTTNAVLMGINGFFVNGAANIISTAVAADLGRQPALQGNSKALATVTGIIDGTGSMGAALGMLVIPPLSTGVGWQAVFYLFIAMMLLTAVCITPIFFHDAMFYWNRVRHRFIQSTVPYEVMEEPQAVESDLNVPDDTGHLKEITD